MVSTSEKFQYGIFVIMIFLTGSFFFTELITGILIKSLSLQADAFHMLSDIVALIFGLYALKISRRGPDDRATFGYARAEIIGGLMNASFLLATCLFIILDSIDRFQHLENDTLAKEVDILLLVGGIGLGINIVGFVLFSLTNRHHHHEHHHDNMNLKGVMLHLLGDSLGSVGVMVSGFIIKYMESPYRFLADPICSLVIVCIIMAHVVPFIYRCYNILLQKAPKEIEMEKVRTEIMALPSIMDVHHFHVWRLSGLKIIASLHVIVNREGLDDLIETYVQIENILHKHGIHSTTIQPEFVVGKSPETCANLVCELDGCTDKRCCEIMESV